MVDHDIAVLASNNEVVFTTWILQKEWGSIFRKSVIWTALDSLCDKHVVDIDTFADEYTMQSSSVPKYRGRNFLVKPQDITIHRGRQKTGMEPVPLPFKFRKNVLKPHLKQLIDSRWLIEHKPCWVKLNY